MRATSQSPMYTTLALLLASISVSSAFDIEPDLGNILDGVGQEPPKAHIDLDSQQSKIVNGELVANRWRYPYFTRIDHENEFSCGGVLVHSDIVLTAAHCHENFDLSVVVNAYNSKEVNWSGHIFRKVMETKRPPDWNQRTLEYDMMLMKLDQPVPSSIPPIRINDNPNEPMDETSLTMIGMGLTRENGPQAEFLMEVELQKISDETCNTISGFAAGELQEECMFCAYTPQKDTCNGDSGGPAIMTDSFGQDVVVGLTSWGYGCARGPGVYSKLSAAYEWLDTTICDLSSNPPDHCKAAELTSASECDDKYWEKFFVNDDLGDKRCMWLSARPDFQVDLCKPDHPSGAYDICPETCGKCKDTCHDSDQRFIVVTDDESDERDCLWLFLRPNEQERLCVQGHDALRLCPETCESCWDTDPSKRWEPTPQPTLPPSPQPTPVPTPSPTPQPTNEQTPVPTPVPTPEPTPQPTPQPTLEPTPEPTSEPTPAPTVGEPSALPSLSPSVVASVAPTSRPSLSSPPSGVASQTPSATPSESSAPSDAICQDDRSGRIFVNDLIGDQSCVWLATKRNTMRTFCVAGHPSNARDICEETCGKCVSTRSNVVDLCVDTKNRFRVGERGPYSCRWLSMRPPAIRKNFCGEIDEAFDVCPKTCGRCERSIEERDLDNFRHNSQQRMLRGS